MNRREFLKAALPVVALAAYGIEEVIDDCIVKTYHYDDNEFKEYVAFIKFQMNIMFDNPGSCARIVGIAEWEEK